MHFYLLMASRTKTLGYIYRNKFTLPMALVLKELINWSEYAFYRVILFYPINKELFSRIMFHALKMRQSIHRNLVDNK